MSDENMKSSIVPSEAAVERELNRRRNVLRLFTGLLFIPLLAAVAFALFGRTDVQMVRKEVKTQVADLPDAKQLAALQEQLSAVPKLSTEVAGVESRLNTLPDAKQLAVLQEQLSGIPKEIAQLKQSSEEEMVSFKATTDRNASAVTQQANRLTVVENRQNDHEVSLKALRSELDKVKESLAREGPTPSDIAMLNGVINRQKETIASQGKTIQELKRQVADVEQKCTLRDRPPGMIQ